MTESSLSGTSTASKTQIRVVVAAVRDLIRHGLETVLGQLPGVTVTATTASTATTVEAVVEHSPDILIVRTNPLQLDAADVAQRLKNMARSVPMLILTTSLDFPEASVAQARQALHAWGSGRVSCVSMDAPVEVLQSALSLMALGYSVLGPEAQAVFVPPSSLAHTVASLESTLFSDKDRDVLRHLLEGRANKEIAEELNVAVRTVEARLSSISAKLGARSRAEVILKLLRPAED